MAFINEVISELDKERVNSFGFKSPYSGKLAETWKWTIDRERNIFLIIIDGAGDKEVRRPCFLALVLNNLVIKIETYVDSKGNSKKRDIVWDIERIIVQSDTSMDANMVTECVKEALIAHGFIYDTAGINKIEFSKISTPVFVGRG